MQNLAVVADSVAGPPARDKATRACLAWILDVPCHDEPIFAASVGVILRGVGVAAAALGGATDNGNGVVGSLDACVVGNRC